MSLQMGRGLEKNRRELEMLATVPGGGLGTSMDGIWIHIQVSRDAFFKISICFATCVEGSGYLS